MLFLKGSETPQRVRTAVSEPLWDLFIFPLRVLTLHLLWPAFLPGSHVL